MKKVILLIALLIGTSAALKVAESPGSISTAIVPTQEKTYNLTESELKEIINIAREGGNAEISRLWTTTMFDLGIIDSYTKGKNIEESNLKAIRFNNMMRGLFNSSGWIPMVEDY